MPEVRVQKPRNRVAIPFVGEKSAPARPFCGALVSIHNIPSEKKYNNNNNNIIISSDTNARKQRLHERGNIISTRSRNCKLFGKLTNAFSFFDRARRTQSVRVYADHNVIVLFQSVI